jgi:hypothetical protein
MLPYNHGLIDDAKLVENNKVNYPESSAFRISESD